jgi:hypothetical protein
LKFTRIAAAFLELTDGLAVDDQLADPCGFTQNSEPEARFVSRSHRFAVSIKRHLRETENSAGLEQG